MTELKETITLEDIEDIEEALKNLGYVGIRENNEFFYTFAKEIDAIDLFTKAGLVKG